MRNLNIIIDTREQLPLFKRGIRRALTVGDYTTKELEHRYHIERKSPQDLYGSIIQGHLRFRNMLLRAKKQKIELVVVVECSAEDFYAKKWSGGERRKTSGKTLMKIIDTMYWKYGIEFIWCKNRRGAARKVKELLQNKESKTNK